jgi:micrococcal nuclease
MTKIRLNTKTLTALMVLFAALLSLVKEVYEPNKSPYNASATGHERVEFSAEVLRTIDGDTVEISRGGKRESVRLIGVDAPEYGTRVKAECYGEESSLRMREIAEGKTVTVRADPTQDEYDKYGRHLAYLYLLDGTNINKTMIADGYAEEYTYTKKYQLQAEFKSAESEAKLASRGLWSACYAR